MTLESLRGFSETSCRAKGNIAIVILRISVLVREEFKALLILVP
tara:strand:+ start:346 stop:477 length:132 start_codon:yes stop_codon:yes gene_type:complete